MQTTHPHRWIASLLIALTLFIGIIPPKTAQAAETIIDDTYFEQINCSELKSTILDPLNSTCGYIHVPENHDQPNGRQIKLAVVIMNSTGISPQSTPLFIAQGGPGGSTIDTYGILMLDHPLREQFDIVLFDQRGTYNSIPYLFCDEYYDLSLSYLSDPEKMEALSEEEQLRLENEAYRDCRERLAGEEIDLNQYNSLQNARDVAEVARVLGYEQINLYGVSYGTLLAQHVMRDTPHILRSVILDAVVPTSINYLTNANATGYEAQQTLFTACAQDETCSASYPDLEETYRQAVAALNDNPVPMKVKDPHTGSMYAVPIDGATLEYLVFQLLYATDFLPVMPRMIADAAAGQFDSLELIMPQLLFDMSLADGMYFSVLCAEDSDFTPQDVNLSGLDEEHQAEAKEEAQSFLNLCELWNVRALDGYVDDPVISDVPTLLMSGNFDPVTPLSYANRLNETLSNSTNTYFPPVGHGALGGNDCADQVALSFLLDPNQPPDTTCTGEITPTFYGRNDLVSVPGTRAIFTSDLTPLIAQIVFLTMLFLLSSSVLVLPIHHFISNRKRKRLQEEYERAQLRMLETGELNQATTPANPREYAPILKYASWFIFFFLILGTILTAAVLYYFYDAYQTLDPALYIGLKGEARWAFFLPWGMLVFAVLILVSNLIMLVRKQRTIFYRVYYTLLTINAAITIAALFTAGYFGILF
ncbi:MAG: alpha/beta fold hydrolase [Anaerolineaceae bacterium]|nr:alpha/beta fold hydrolase [Anaerolineaceae bacterium]